ncbi:hypothetical protein KY285_020808 [Solanum tuberosum]|nr:hypothetical protein KY285_020808 [Solanum tuberosum]
MKSKDVSNRNVNVLAEDKERIKMQEEWLIKASKMSRGIGVIIVGPIMRCSPRAKPRGAPNKYQLQGTPPQFFVPII